MGKKVRQTRERDSGLALEGDGELIQNSPDLYLRLMFEECNGGSSMCCRSLISRNLVVIKAPDLVLINHSPRSGVVLSASIGSVARVLVFLPFKAAPKGKKPKTQVSNLNLDEFCCPILWRSL